MSPLPAPLTPPDCDVSYLPWFPLKHKRLTGSDWWMAASDFARSRNVDLWCEAFTQVPAASLPDKDAELAKFAGFGRDVAAFQAVKAELMAPWVLCDDGRWYHPTLSEIALECAANAQRDAAARAADAERKRLARGKSRDASAPVRRTSAGHPADVARTRETAETRGDQPETAPSAECPADAEAVSGGRSRDEDLNRGIYITPPTPPAGGPRTSGGREVEEEGGAAFDRAFRAFPLEGTSSSPPELSWPAFEREFTERRLSPGRLADAAVAYAAWVGQEPSRLRRVPAFHRWLARGNYAVFLTKEVAASLPAWAGPDDIWAEAVRVQSEGWAKSWLAQTSWRDLPSRAIVCRSRSVRDRLRAALGEILAEREVAIILEAAA